MKVKFLFSAILILLLPGSAKAQDPDKKILMTLAGRDVEAGEFIRMFNKSLDPGNKTGINAFLDQFVDFKLKVADAIAEGYDTTEAYLNELKGYRNQLAQSYLTDSDIKEKLLRKAYERSLSEVKASHILINCAPDAMPDDTVKAFRKALEVRERILKGEPFEQVAKAVSDDKSVLLNGGNLGYFTVFQMITPFEEAAFGLTPGSLSMPVRTPFGYHLIKVADKRPSRGRIRVAHIMKTVPPGSPDSLSQKAKSEIDAIYLKLQNGEAFHDLAVKYSDHRESAARGGEMNIFGTGEIIPDFAEAAFTLKDTGDYTNPVKTIYGYHIIKLLEKKAPDSYEEARPYLESKLNQSNLSSIGRSSFVARLKKEYGFRINTPVYRWFVANTDTLIIRGQTKYKRENIPEGNIFSFSDQYLSSIDFADYLENRGNMMITNNPAQFIDASIESIVADKIIRYEDSILEEKYPDFRYLMIEFHDGILLFDISSKKVWNKVQEDSTGLMDYYETHKNNFLSKKGIEGRILTLNTSDPSKAAKVSKNLAAAYKRFKGKADADARLYAKFNRNGDTLLTINEGRWVEGDDHEIDELNWIAGVQTFIKNGMPSLIDIKRIEKPEPLSFDEVKADMISGYQDWLTEEWIRQLKEKYPVKIDNLVFEEVKKRISNE